MVFGDTINGVKYRWEIPTIDHQKAVALSSVYGLSIPVVMVMINRGYDTIEKIEAFLTSTYEKDVPDPVLLKDAQKTVDRIEVAIQNNEKILVFGDYDVDGITSSALMMIGLTPLKARVNFFLPNRVKDGYGISTPLVERAHKNGYTLIITVDNGITAFEPARRAKELGVDLIITDHHKAHGDVPDAYAIVNPNQHDCPYPFKSLAGVGVSFKVLSLLYRMRGVPLPEKVYELLLLGTVADVVPLKGENRYWVRHGLSLINTVYSLSFQTLKQHGKLDKPYVTATDIGFSITPQINALGRLDDPREGVAFLVGHDASRVQATGKVLWELNEARKQIEREIIDHIEADIKQKRIDLDKDYVIVAAHHSWRAGVIGLVASRIVAAYGRPVILLHITNYGIAKGSCRSIPGLSMFDMLAANKDIIEQFGGHPMAAGLSIATDKIEVLKERLNGYVAARYQLTDLAPKVFVDGILDMADVDKKIMNDLKMLEPFGCENSEPVFCMHNVVLVSAPDLLKDLHVKCHIMAGTVVRPIIFFNRPDLYSLLCNVGTTPFSVIARLQEQWWQGNVSVQLLGVDVAVYKETV